MQKKSFYLIIAFFLLTLKCGFAQNVSISDIDRTPNASAILDLYSTTKGLLIPNLALVQSTSSAPVTAPATSLIVYNTATSMNVIPGFYFWNGASWQRIGASNYLFTNGLTELSSTVKLGGNLIESTTLTQDGTENLSFINDGSGLTLFNLTNTGDFQIKANDGYAFYVRDDANVGIGTSNPSYKLQVVSSSTGTYRTVAFFQNTDGTEDGSSSVFGYLVPSGAGTSYGRAFLKAAVKGYVSIGESYTAGVAGYRFNTSAPYTAGVIGVSSHSNEPTVWGALGYKGYKNSALYDYAGYFNGDIALTGNINIQNQYMNFSTTMGFDGYGIRDREGTIEFKNSGGVWNPMPLPPPSGASTEWWYKPSNSNWIQPISNDNIRVYDSGQDIGFYYNGASNKIAGFFRTTSGVDGSTSVQGFSDVAGKTTYGYLGYNGTFTAALTPGYDFEVNGAAVYGVVTDPDRVSVFGRTTNDATFASIIGYSDAWISGYFLAKDESGITQSARPSFYAELLTTQNKEVGERQPAIQAYSEFTGTSNDGYTIGGDFTAIGKCQDAYGLNVYSNTDGTTTGAINVGVNVYVEGGETVYGNYILAGNSKNDNNAFGVWAEANTDVGTGIVAAGNNVAAAYLSIGSGAAFKGKDLGLYVTNEAGYTGTGYSWVDLGAASIFAECPHSGAAATASIYQFAVIGQKTQTTTVIDRRSGGILGINYNETTSISDSWGALGYKNSASSNIGVYGNAGYSTLGKKSDIKNGVAVAGYGELFGAWFRGETYGLAVKGERIGLFVDGNTYTTKTIAQITETEDKTITTYVPTSTTQDVYAKGVAKLENGKAFIKFDQDFYLLASQESPIIVTVTPIGKCNGIYLEEVKSSGFVVCEANEGKSSVAFNYIAIATRKDADKYKVPVEITDKNFDDNLTKYMANEEDDQAKRINMF